MRKATIVGRTGTGLAAGALLLAGAGCGERRAEAEIGRFELVATQAGELPALLGERDGCRFEAVGGEVELKPDSLYTARLDRRRVCDPSALGDSLTADTTFRDPGEGRYALEGDSVFFRFSRGGSAGYGQIRGDTLVVQGPGQTLYYTRAPR